MQSLKQFIKHNTLTEGGNVVVGDEAAQKIDLETVDRDKVTDLIFEGLQELNRRFAKFAGIKLWNDEVFSDLSFLSGSSVHFFNKEIPTDEFLGDKETLESSSTSRRDFLKYVGFSTAAASLAACEGPVMKSIPYVVQPERIVPGVANYYATTMADGFDFAGVLVKTREGRPIKIEHNTMANTGANARVQASVLSLYDNKRLQQII